MYKNSFTDYIFKVIKLAAQPHNINIVMMLSTGKSTVMSLLAGCKQDDSRSFFFKPQSAEHLETAQHQTSGIDLFVTEERMILLDSQPLLSASVLDHLIQFEKKYPGEFTTTENCIEVQSLQVLFLMFFTKRWYNLF